MTNGACAITSASRAGCRLTKTTRCAPATSSSRASWATPSRSPRPFTPVAKTRRSAPSIPLRLIGLETRSGYSDVSRGFWPFGISTGVIDRVRAVQVGERHPTLEYLTMDCPQAAEQIVSGIYASDQLDVAAAPWWC